MIRRLGLGVSTARGLGLMIPGLGTKIRNAEQLKHKQSSTEI